MTTQTNRLPLVMAGALSLLLIPLVGMQFSDAVDWKLFDFVLMGSLLALTAFAGYTIWTKVNQPKQRIVLIAGVVFLFLLVWAELAVGVFGTPFAGN